MSLIKAEPGDVVSLTYFATDRAMNLYPKAFIYDTSGNEITTVNLSHLANGYYTGNYTTTGAYKHLLVHYVVYSDAARTIPAAYETSEDKIYVGYDFKPSFGEVESRAVISDKDKKDIADTILEKIDFSELLEEIRKKSEFNPKKDKVKTDIKIPVVSLREVNDKLDVIKKLASEKTKQFDYSGNFIKIDRQFNEVKGLVDSEIKVVRGNVEQAIKQIESIQVPDKVDLQPILAGIDVILEQDIESSKERELLRINLEKALTDLYVSSQRKQEELQNKLIKELLVIQKSMPNLEKMLEALNKEDFNRINLVVEELKKINQFLKIISSMLVNKKLGEEEDFSGIFDLLKSNIKT